MAFRELGYAVLAVLVAGTALAHAGVKDPDVAARMHAMKAIGEDAKVLGSMVKSEALFDSTAASAALSRIAARAGEVPALFEKQSDDPASEARPLIWQRFGDFAAEAKALEMAAVSAKVDTREELRVSMASLAKACGSCHETFRK